MIPIGPDYSGATLGNLAAELEMRLTGKSELPGLHEELATRVPDADGVVVLLLDGLGSPQLDHAEASTLLASHQGDLEAPFPATTTVSLATFATATAPARHGLVAYLLNLPGHGVVNTIKWITPGAGRPVSVDLDHFLPGPNLWERLSDAEIEPVVVQPGNFEGSGLTRTLYRGCRFEPYWDPADLVRAVCQLARPGRFVFAYLPHLDFHAHVSGQRSAEYAAAVRLASSVWSGLQNGVDDRLALVATGDHGHIDIAPADKHRVSSRGLTMYGDPRSLLISGPDEEVRGRLAHVPGRLIPIDEARAWWGPGPDHPDLDSRLPDFVFLPDPASIALPGFMDDRLVGYHGGLDPAEAIVPLIVRQ